MHCWDCRRYSCLCKEEEQLKVVQYLLDQGADLLPKNSPWGQSVLQQAVNRKHKKLRHLLLQTIIDTPGISLDEIRENLDFAEAEELFGKRPESLKLVDDYYWRKIYPVP